MWAIRRQFLHPWNSKHNRLTRIASFTMKAAVVLAVIVALLNNLYQREEVVRQKAAVQDQMEVIRQMDTVLGGRARFVVDGRVTACKSRNEIQLVKGIPSAY
jgi:hypothetical protein